MRSMTSVLAVALICAGLMTQPARAELAPSAAAAVSLEVGDRAPDFSATMADGQTYNFSGGHRQRPAVLVFYRGGWCPYCNAQLSGLHEIEPKLRAKGFEVIFVSTDRPQLLYSSLKDRNIHYTLLSDGNLRAAQAFHIAYHLTDEQYAEELKWGVDLEKTTGSSEHGLPVPSVYVIDESGVIRFVYSNPDFRVRLAADDLWKAALPFAPPTK